jgi:KDO2-lipid IV(A) lauroyltransferase
MAKERSPVADYAVYLAVRWLVTVIQALPERIAYGLARCLAAFVYRIDRRHRLVARENLQRAFPERFAEPLSPTRAAQLDRIVRGVYEHFCGLLVEIVRLPRTIHVHNRGDLLKLSGAKPIIDGLLAGRSFMIVTGHLGNWELAGYALGLIGYQTYAVARTLDNPYLDAYLRSFREGTGQRVLAKKGDFDQMTAVLQQGGALATLADQDAGPRGVFVNFFGRPASTHKAIALMALEFQVPLVVCGIPKVRWPRQYECMVTDVIDPSEYAGQRDAVTAITQRYTTALEAIIRQYPEQYFWLHRRWKSQPIVGAKRQAA